MSKKQPLIIFLIILISFFFLENPLFAKKIRPNVRLKSCQYNIREIVGAIEMYYMDNTEIIQTALPGGDFEDLENMLIHGKYLKEHIEGPEDDCSYGYIRFIKDYEYVVFCKRHGTLETKDEYSPILPKYNKSDEKPFSKAYLSKKAAKERSKAFSSFLNDYVFSPISIIIYFLLLIFFSILPNKKKKQDN